MSSIATLDAVDVLRAYLELDAVLGLEGDLPTADRLRALVGFGETARIWSPVAGLYDDGSGLVPWRNQVPALIYEVTNEEPQVDNGSIAAQVAFKCYGGPDAVVPSAVTYRQARKVARALRARLHNVSGGSAGGGRSIMRSDQNIASQAAVDDDGFPFVLAGYGLTIQ